jgi:hypothetical protein
VAFHEPEVEKKEGDQAKKGGAGSLMILGHNRMARPKQMGTRWPVISNAIE